MWSQLNSCISGPESPFQTLPPVPTTTTNSTGNFSVPGHYVPTPLASCQQGILDGNPSIASTAQYQAYMAVNSSTSREPPSSRDDVGV